MLRIGMLTPSSNTVLEPVTYRIIADAPGISVHFSRFTVTEIALDQAALHQFDDAPILRAAELLAHAKVDVIAWNGTSASWLGLGRDRDLVARIESATGIRAATCMLGFFELARAKNHSRIGLVTPYTRDVQERIMANYKTEGVDVVAEQHLDIRDNFTFGTVGETHIGDMISDTAQAKPDAIWIVCTNMNGASEAARLEKALQIPVYDSVAVTLWACMRRAGADPSRITGWGQIFEA
ncbi:MAG: maleate cis-trans isomerase family protein [Beijerinckiaceae bacterium]